MSTYDPNHRYYACSADECPTITQVTDSAPDDFEPVCLAHREDPMRRLSFDEFVEYLPEDERPAQDVDQPEGV